MPEIRIRMYGTYCKVKNSHLFLLFEADAELFKQTVAQVMQLLPEEIELIEERTAETQSSTLVFTIENRDEWMCEANDACAQKLAEALCMRCKYLREEIDFSVNVHGHSTKGCYTHAPRSD